MYGLDKTKIPHIVDTTPGAMKLAILFIMILLIYIAYQVVNILWNTKKSLKTTILKNLIRTPIIRKLQERQSRKRYSAKKRKKS